MEKIITLIINRRWLIATVFGIVSIFGFYAWRQLPIDAYPDIADVTVQVVTQVPGLAAEEIEQQISIPLERELNGIPALQTMRSTNTFGLSVIVMVFVLPMWINFSLRITALKEVLTLLEGNLARYPFLNAVVGITYDFLPFMILPIFTTLSKLDGSLREAAMDLGADKVQTFLQVTLPLSVPGIVSGVSMVFLPAMTNYVVLDMLYNSTYIMGSLIGSYFSAYNWHGGSMIALILLAIICLFTLLTSTGEENAERGGALL
jgi:ABC-type spermidine/putrescine transport system permease subunit I